jgi:hypothetical protein
MQKISLKNITRGQWITIASVTIMLVVVLIFIFRKVDTPGLTDTEKDLIHRIDSMATVIEVLQDEHARKDSIRRRENDSLAISINVLKSRVNTNTIYYEKVIERVRDASPAELERLFSERYER